jgi:hypothetical protein
MMFGHLLCKESIDLPPAPSQWRVFIITEQYIHHERVRPEEPIPVMDNLSEYSSVR